MQQAEFFVILDRFLPFYPPMDPENQNFEKMKKPPEDMIILHMCMVPEICSAMDRCFSHFEPFFSLFFPNNPKNQNFEKMAKKTPGDIINLHMCTIITIIRCMVPEI